MEYLFSRIISFVVTGVTYTNSYLGLKDLLVEKITNLRLKKLIEHQSFDNIIYKINDPQLIALVLKFATEHSDGKSITILRDLVKKILSIVTNQDLREDIVKLIQHVFDFKQTERIQPILKSLLNELSYKKNIDSFNELLNFFINNNQNAQSKSASDPLNSNNPDSSNSLLQTILNLEIFTEEKNINLAIKIFFEILNSCENHFRQYNTTHQDFQQKLCDLEITYRREYGLLTNRYALISTTERRQIFDQHKQGLQSLKEKYEQDKQKIMSDRSKALDELSRTFYPDIPLDIFEKLKTQSSFPLLIKILNKFIKLDTEEKRVKFSKLLSQIINPTIEEPLDLNLLFEFIIKALSQFEGEEVFIQEDIKKLLQNKFIKSKLGKYEGLVLFLIDQKFKKKDLQTLLSIGYAFLPSSTPEQSNAILERLRAIWKLHHPKTSSSSTENTDKEPEAQQNDVFYTLIPSILEILTELNLSQIVLIVQNKHVILHFLAKYNIEEIISKLDTDILKEFISIINKEYSRSILPALERNDHDNDQAKQAYLYSQLQNRMPYFCLKILSEFLASKKIRDITRDSLSKLLPYCKNVLESKGSKEDSIFYVGLSILKKITPENLDKTINPEVLSQSFKATGEVVGAFLSDDDFLLSNKFPDKYKSWQQQALSLNKEIESLTLKSKLTDAECFSMAQMQYFKMLCVSIPCILVKIKEDCEQTEDNCLLKTIVTLIDNKDFYNFLSIKLQASFVENPQISTEDAKKRAADLILILQKSFKIIEGSNSNEICVVLKVAINAFVSQDLDKAKLNSKNAESDLLKLKFKNKKSLFYYIKLIFLEKLTFFSRSKIINDIVHLALDNKEQFHLIIQEVAKLQNKDSSKIAKLNASRKIIIILLVIKYKQLKEKLNDKKKKFKDMICNVLKKNSKSNNHQSNPLE
jgi:hypothetical protein